MRFIKSALIFITIAFFIVACGKTEPANTNVASNEIVVTNHNTQSNVVPDEITAARKIYSEHCVRCHKESGEGGRVEIEGKRLNVEDLRTDKMKKMADSKYVKYIENGVLEEGMPAFKDTLSDEQIKSLVKFIRTEIQKN